MKTTSWEQTRGMLRSIGGVTALLGKRIDQARSEAKADAQAASKLARGAKEAAVAAQETAEAAKQAAVRQPLEINGVRYDGTAAVSMTIGGEEVIPAYWKAHLESRAFDIRKAMKAAGHQKSAVLFYTDAHWTNNFKSSPMILRYLQKYTPVNKVIFGGDAVSAESDYATTMEYLWTQWRSALSGVKNHHSVPGMEDDGEAKDGRFNEAYVYSFLLAPEEGPEVVRGDAGLYYHVDVPGEKTRYLYLDTATKAGSIENDPAQQAWLRQALRETPAGWHIVAAAHRWLTWDYGYVPARTAMSAAGRLCLDLFDEYNAREGEFAGCEGRVEFCLGGHIHADAEACSMGGIPVILLPCDSCNVRSGDCVEGTVTESSVSAVITDYAAGKIHIICVGRGESRVTPLRLPVNQLAIATDADGGIYNGTGYKDNARISTATQEEVAANGWDLTGFIPAGRGDVIRMRNMEMMDTAGTAQSSRAMIYYFYADRSWCGYSAAFSPESLPDAAWKAVYGPDGNIIELTIPSTAGAEGLSYIRIGAKQIDEDAYITVNEEID